MNEYILVRQNFTFLCSHPLLKGKWSFFAPFLYLQWAHLEITLQLFGVNIALI